MNRAFALASPVDCMFATTADTEWADAFRLVHGGPST